LGEHHAHLSRREKIQQQIQGLERTRESDLREKKRIGQVTNKAREPDYRVSVRRVNFRWQRGNKIG
jgi:mitogen-activated protein kinase kinase kinase 4